MSLITRCPACGTMFKVVTDQLKISQGWVRCGHCAEIFDAAAYLQDREGPPARARSPLPPLPPPAAQVEEPAQPAVVAREEPAAAPPAEAVVPGLETDFDPFLEPAAVSVPPPVAPARKAAAEPDLGHVSFVRQARRKALWQRPVVRAMLGLVVLLLAALLGLQYAVQERDRLAAAEPALKPWLESLCEPLQCKIGPPRQIEAIVIDASSFNKLRGEAYRLNLTLKNQLAMEVAIPAIELTLTDTQDQPVIRRVLQPREMGAPSAVIAPSSDWSGSVALSVAPGASTARIAGYRLLAFYP